MARRLLALVMLLVTGCAHQHAAATRLAQDAAYLCKHCNCFMPADVDPQKTCPVCHCGYPAHTCRRGGS